MSDTDGVPPEVSAAMGSRPTPEMDHQWVRQQIAQVVEQGMRAAGAINEYHEDQVVDAILALAGPKGQKLVFTRPEVFQIFRRVQNIMEHQPTAGEVASGR